MNKILIALVLAVVMSGNVFAEDIKLLQKKSLGSRINPSAETYCVEGYMFVVFRKRNGIASSQIFTNQDGKSLPKEC